jgi:hypothetical protein
MAKDFNVYQWRRQHLNENQVSENETSWKEDFEGIMNANNLNQGEVHDFISLYFKDKKGKPLNISLNEGNSIIKTIKDLTWSDVEGVSLPTKSVGINHPMEKGKENLLKFWKNLFKDDEKETVEIKIENGKAEFVNLNQSDPIGAQAAADKKAGINPRLD